MRYPSSRCRWAFAAALAALGGSPAFAEARSTKVASPDVSAEAQSASTVVAAPAWSVASPFLREDLARGRPLVVQVVVPLCSNRQIDCGASWAGQAGRAKTNVYWGALYGARRFLERRDSGYERVSVAAGDGKFVVERAVYRRYFDGKPWGLARDIEQIVLLAAIHGDRIDGAVERFWKLATNEAHVHFVDAGHERTERLHVVGYAGHNRLMDGLTLPDVDPTSRSPGFNPAFVLACYSDRYFSASLTAAGSTPLVTTRALMAPEGYLVHAIVEGLAQNLSLPELRQRAIKSYARWQRISERQARTIFVP